MPLQPLEFRPRLEVDLEQRSVRMSVSDFIVWTSDLRHPSPALLGGLILSRHVGDNHVILTERGVFALCGAFNLMTLAVPEPDLELIVEQLELELRRMDTKVRKATETRARLEGAR